jgi:hypothetical protein
MSFDSLVALALILVALVLAYAITAWAVIRWRESEIERRRVNFEMKRLRFAQRQHLDMFDVARTRMMGNYPTPPRRRDGDN